MLPSVSGTGGRSQDGIETRSANAAPAVNGKFEAGNTRVFPGSSVCANLSGQNAKRIVPSAVRRLSPGETTMPAIAGCHELVPAH
jgi:hypothetical protein